MMIIENLEAWGHENIVAKNKTTFEITKEAHLSKKGDCIIGIRASKGLSELSDGFKRLARKETSIITVILQVDRYEEIAIGRGSAQLTFKHPTDVVARKSIYTCERTLMIKTNKAARDLSRDLIDSLKKQTQKIKVTFIVDS